MTGAASMVLAGGLVALSLAGAGETAVEVGARFAAISLLSLLAALVLGWSPLVPVSLAFLGAVYATQLVADDVPVDAKAPLLAAGLFLAAELAYWSLDERDAAREERGESLRRAGLVALLGLAALATAALVLAAADLTQARGLAVDLVGAAAAAGAILAVVLLAQRATKG